MSQDAPSWTPLPILIAGVGQTTPHAVHEFMPSASAGAGTSARPVRNVPRRRYPQPVYDILIDYYNNVSKYPKKPELERLVARIKTIPGCEDYSVDKAYGYFAQKRQTLGDTRRKDVQRPSTSGHILYPSIADKMSVVAKLDVLLYETPEPQLELARIWANRLGHGVTPEDIITYADLKRIQKRDENPPLAPTRVRLSSQLPTPESSISPEPRSTPTSPVVECSWGKREPEEDVKDELQDDIEDQLTSQLTVPALNPEPKLQGHQDSRLAVIADKFSKALAMQPALSENQAGPPKTFKELANWFKEQQAATIVLETPGRSKA
ncbi:hypothetical protein BD414DRAFT_510992 [Trametes punicea]|nr:hypothetical protein BD414DRAFT_510992 [Trametes punicea]